MRVQYNEGTDSLTVPGCGIAVRGEAIEVPEAVGKSLIEQGWSESGKSSKPDKKTPPVVESADDNKESI